MGLEKYVHPLTSQLIVQEFTYFCTLVIIILNHRARPTYRIILVRSGIKKSTLLRLLPVLPH